MSADVFLTRARAMDARGIAHGAHSSRFDVDEDALPIGTSALAQVTMDYVQKGGLSIVSPAREVARRIAQSMLP